jgi:hypothetical protein
MHSMCHQELNGGEKKLISRKALQTRRRSEGRREGIRSVGEVYGLMLTSHPRAKKRIKCP